MRRSFVSSLLVQLWLPVLIVLLLWFGTAHSTSFYFPPFKEMLGAMWTGLTTGTLKTDLWFSLTNILLGTGLALLVGVFLGLVIGEQARLRMATAPFLDYARATPTIAFVPVLTLAFGIGAGPKIILIFLGALWPILLNTISGVAGINPAINETARSYRIPWHLRLLKVTMPGATPQIFAGVRIALQVAIVLMVVSEIYGSAIGLGNFILQSGSSFRVADTWGGTILIGILGYLLSVALLVAEHLILGWHFQRPPRTRRIDRVRQVRPPVPASA